MCASLVILAKMASLPTTLSHGTAISDFFSKLGKRAAHDS
jgi:hypothetical protein